MGEGGCDVWRKGVDVCGREEWGSDNYKESGDRNVYTSYLHVLNSKHLATVFCFQSRPVTNDIVF